MKKFLKFILIIIPVLLLMGGVLLYFALKAAERYDEPLKEGVADYIEQATGLRAEIGTLNEFSFIPTLTIDMEDIRLNEAGNVANTKIKIEQFVVKLPAAAMLTGAQKLEALSLKNFEDNDAVFLPYALKIKHAAVKDVANNRPPQLSGEGRYNKKPFRFALDLDKEDEIYSLPKRTPLLIAYDNHIFKGDLTLKGRNLYLKQAGFVENSTEQPAVTKDYVLVEKRLIIADNPIACFIQTGQAAFCKREMIENIYSAEEEKKE